MKAPQYRRNYWFSNISVYLLFTAVVAQLVEPQIVTLVVAGSSPVDRPKDCVLQTPRHFTVAFVLSVGSLRN